MSSWQIGLDGGPSQAEDPPPAHDGRGPPTPPPGDTSRAVPDAVAGILSDRDSRYGDYGLQSRLAQTLKGAVRRHFTTATLAPDMEESIEMILLKISRICCGDPDYPDNWLDIEGYARLVSRRLR